MILSLIGMLTTQNLRTYLSLMNSIQAILILHQKVFLLKMYKQFKPEYERALAVKEKYEGIQKTQKEWHEEYQHVLQKEKYNSFIHKCGEMSAAIDNMVLREIKQCMDNLECITNGLVVHET